MKKLLYVSALAFCAGLCACSNDDLIGERVSSPSNEIVMNPILKNVTRATVSHDLATDNLSTFCVTAYHGEDLYFQNVDFVRSGSNWLAANKYYWPESGSLTFYSYAPREDGNGIERTGYHTFTVTQQALAADQPDFIVSKTTTDKERSAAGVTANFRHAMSRIALQVKNSNVGLKMKVTDWKIGNLYNKGYFTLNDDDTDNHNFRLDATDWSLNGEGCVQSIETEISNSPVSAYTVEPGSASQSVTGFKDFIAIPQQLIDKPNYTSAATGAPFAGSYIAVEMEILNAADDAIIAEKQWCYWPIATQWRSGNRYTYTIDLSSGGFKGRNNDGDDTGDGDDDDDDEFDPVLKNAEISFVNCKVDEWDELGEPISNILIAKSKVKVLWGNEADLDVFGALGYLSTGFVPKGTEPAPEGVTVSVSSDRSHIHVQVDEDSPIGTYTYSVTDAETSSSAFFSVTVSDGHDLVDLGLSVLWATQNVGAEYPESYGLYFSFGNIEGHHLNKTSDGYDFENDYKNTPGYLLKQSIAAYDAEHDPATAAWGSNYRMPTKLEMQELLNECTWTPTSDYEGTGVKGQIVTGPSGNSIFLPNAGCFNFNYKNYNGIYYMGSTYNTSVTDNIMTCDYKGEARNIANSGMTHGGGYTVRPVSAKH